MDVQRDTRIWGSALDKIVATLPEKTLSLDLSKFGNVLDDRLLDQIVEKCQQLEEITLASHYPYVTVEGWKALERSFIKSLERESGSWKRCRSNVH